ncbi:MAG: 50S ribosomal protein L25 [Candidatus Sumerlaeia bacterium]|nr:50S ribosomal protein L25 [Candidatus Sumerlaeia bacterium]
MSSAKLALNAQVRADKRGKEYAAKLRQQGKIPGVVYGAHQDTVSLELESHAFDGVRASLRGEQLLVDLNLSNGVKEKVFIKSVQREPLSQRIIHVDLLRVNLNEAITLPVPVSGIGVPYGVRNDGGMLEQVLRTVTITCLPEKMPPHIDVDLTNMLVGQSVHVYDLPKLEGVTYAHPEQVIFACLSKTEEKAVAAPAGAAPAAAAAGAKV